MDIKALNIKVKISSNEILKGVTLKTDKHKFIGIIGPNGCGKSTFLKSIYRVLKPDSGEILLDGVELSKVSTKESAKKIAIVSQHNYYNFDFSVEEVVLMGRNPHKKLMELDNIEDYRIVEESLNTVGMLQFKKRSFSTLSGGEQQRVILARALAQKTDCLILDEPTNHLDIKYQLQLLDIVSTLDITIISAMHDLNIASMYCDYLYVIQDGIVVAQGEPKQVLTKELILMVYGVDVNIFVDSDNITHILYHPQQVK